MKTRSSRFFIILLHLLGVSNHHLPSWYYDYYLAHTAAPSSTSGDQRSSFYSGIRGVHPHSITLERLDLGEIGGLDAVDWLGGKEDNQQQQQPHQDLTREPFWLQDTLDGKCLGPSGGFSECGDATLWFILRRRNQRKSLRMGPFGVEEVLERPDPEEPYRYALQIVDNDYELSSSASSPSESTTTSFLFSWSFQRQRRRQQQQNDCLVSAKSRHPQQQQGQQEQESLLELGSCAQQQTAWSWRVNPQGFLYLPDDASQSKGKECLRRNNASSAVLSSCQDEEYSSRQHRLVQFSLVRYHATANPSIPPPSANTMSRSKTNDQHAKARPESKKDMNRKEPTQRAEQKSSNDNNKQGGGLPSTKDKAHSHASDAVRHMHSPIFEMNLAGRPLKSSIPSPQARREAQSSPFAALKDTNPILFLGKNSDGSATKSTTGSKNKRRMNKPGKSSSTPPPQQQHMSPRKLRKIEMNPYIAASNDEIWVDPLTGLEYHTDLCRYLGHDRKEYGRHTLVGVGQFMKTMLKIKVYGIAFYVSKRDVLSDPSFQEYAGQSSEELRNQPGFYEKLRSRGGFDRTLVLKTNMQLATETMRSSLDSDWKMLTEDDKKLLINSSMEPRPAEQQMLNEIRRADNPSRCSCAQTAPDEYEADPSCCARGIELAFTWRKNGDFEIRLNWRLMDAYPRPDIGLGVFFEYLRTDDPFSPDFLERAVDGFPFLLAPLAQVQGITSSVMQSAPSEVTKEPAHVSLMKGVGGAADAVTSHVVGLATAMHQGAADTAANAAHAVLSAGDTVRHFGEVAELKRAATWKQMVTFSQNPTEVFSEFVARAKGEKNDEIEVPVEPEHQDAAPIRNAPHGKIFRPTTSKWFGETMDAPDEIGPMVHPTMNKTILSLVHLYLLLILIVSFPATNASKTRFVVRRSCKMMSVSSSETSLLRFEVESGEKHISPRKNMPCPLYDYHKISGHERPLIAPEPPRTNDDHDDGHLVGLCPEDDNDPASVTHSPQRIHIDLTSQEERKCKKFTDRRNSKSFISGRTARSHSLDLDCPESERSNVSDVSSENSGMDKIKNGSKSKNGKKKDSANDKMKKSLSYFTI